MQYKHSTKFTILKRRFCEFLSYHNRHFLPAYYLIAKNPADSSAGFYGMPMARHAKSPSRIDEKFLS